MINGSWIQVNGTMKFHGCEAMTSGGPDAVFVQSTFHVCDLAGAMFAEGDVVSSALMEFNGCQAGEEGQAHSAGGAASILCVGIADACICAKVVKAVQLWPPATSGKKTDA